jgi:P pilus assembly chaperone PapD
MIIKGIPSDRKKSNYKQMKSSMTLATHIGMIVKPATCLPQAGIPCDKWKSIIIT